MKPTWLAAWQDIPAGTHSNPFMNNGFLKALEESGACSKDSGWQPSHLKLFSGITAPAYIKNNSWGEYVFDWAWASAYEQYGLQYYPKLVIAAPYTPSQGPRLLGARSTEDVHLIVQALKEKCHSDNLSGFHILFPEATEQAWLNQQPLLKRSDVQFQWHNHQYRDFNDFLERFSSRKRKNIRKERNSIADQGIEMKILSGAEISDTHWHEFYQFYHATYLKRGRQGYLNKAFFDLVREYLRDQIVLILAFKNKKAIAAALCFKDQHTLYGRYWGCFEEFNNLHFEACYYQGIEYCIKHGLKRFDPGTQGEHKIARGFEPLLTHSYHWLSHPQFFEAARRFCDDEEKMTAQYLLQTRAALPFKQT